MATISLGMRHGTKLRRQQWISVDPLEDPIGAFLIGVFRWSSPPGAAC